jgi:hypothetical protein
MTPDHRVHVKVRTEPRTVPHEEYGFRTVVAPADFAVFECAVKFHQAWYGKLCDQNDIQLPSISESWDAGKRNEAANEYRHCVSQLAKRTGTYAETGEERCLYYALLD